MPKIFISYSRKNIDAANYIAGELRDRGAEVFIDYQSIQAGQSFPRRLADEVKSSDAIVFLLSEHSATSQWVISEVYYAREHKKLIVPIALDTTELPDDLFFLSPIDRVDFKNWSQGKPAQSALHKLLTALSLPTAKPQEPRIPSPPSPPMAENQEKIPSHPSTTLKRQFRFLLIFALLVGVIGSAAIFTLYWEDLFPTPILTRRGIAERGVQSNAEWPLPFMQTFNRVNMMLVPAGCFDMGSENGEKDEQPVQKVCFEKPFWIDRTEVTNNQFNVIGGQAAHGSYWTQAARPRESITWYEAKAFCELRDARLPTEAEWEYAARGPDGLKYPWGDEFVSEAVVYYENSNNRTAEIGRYSSGASWVGALDMSGNVWEWVSSIYQPYPYSIENKLEDSNSADAPHVRRGGSFSNNLIYLHTTLRSRLNPSVQINNLGFRCVRDY